VSGTGEAYAMAPTNNTTAQKAISRKLFMVILSGCDIWSLLKIKDIIIHIKLSEIFNIIVA